MIVDCEVDRLFVVSDLHLGSPVSTSAADLCGFVDHVAEVGGSLCINGDGFDLLQGDVASILAASLPVVRRLRRLLAAGGGVHYVLGNHDLALEHVLLDLPIPVSPYLDVRSGGARIRVEHGHVHDPFYARWPGAYELGGRLGRLALVANADVYRLWSAAQQRVDRRRRGHGRRGAYPHHASAQLLFDRGFDAVVFGHTHLPERTELPGGLFVNGGDWLGHRTVVVIEGGEVRLTEWDGRRLIPCA